MSYIPTGWRLKRLSVIISGIYYLILMEARGVGKSKASGEPLCFWRREVIKSVGWVLMRMEARGEGEANLSGVCLYCRRREANTSDEFQNST